MKEASSKHPNLVHEIKPFLNKEAPERTSVFESGSVQTMREQYEKMQEEYKYTVTAETSDISIESQGKEVSVRIIRPEGAEGNLPIIFYLHGGGTVAGSAQSYDCFLKTLANGANAAVVFPSYSLSPEVKYPVAINECYDVLTHIYDNAAVYKLNGDKIALAGDSSGANFAAVLAIIAKNKKGPVLTMQMLLCPLTDWNLATDTINEQFSDGPWLTKEGLKWYRKAYLDNKGERDNVDVSPLIAEYGVLNGLPDTFIITAENDPLRDDGEAYARRLNKADVRVSCIRYNGTIHDFMVLNGLNESKPTRRAIEQICSTLKDVLHS